MDDKMFGFIGKFHVQEVLLSYRSLSAFNIIRKGRKYLFPGATDFSGKQTNKPFNIRCVFSSFPLAESPPHDLQIAAYE